jgi:hypothetical protein
MRRIWLALFYCIVFAANAQKETCKWYFGNKAALDFSSGSPVSVSNSTMTAIEGCASVADAQGNLLFYSNGLEVFNKNHQYLDNSSNPFLIGQTSSTQSSLIIKRPGSGNLYYIFTTGASGTGTLAYSVVDMSLSAGMGSVTVKNNTLIGSVTEKLTATKHCNGADFWIITHKYNSTEFYSYLLSASGVNSTPVISSVGSVHAPGTNTVSFIGAMKISPTGKKLGLGIYREQNNIELFDFDNLTGQVSNPIILGTHTGYACEFSPDGTKFYAVDVVSQSNPGRIHQWDLCAGSASAIIASKQSVNTVSVIAGAMQLSTDGKIYISENTLSSLGVINNPNLTGTAMNYVPQAVALSTGTCASGLPNFVGSDFRDKGTTAYTLSCSSGNFTFNSPGCSSGGYSLTSAAWNFGDPASASSNTSILLNPIHSYPSNGSYTVTFVAHYNCFSDTLKQVISVSTLPTLSVTGNKNLCTGNATTLNVTGASQYTWSNSKNTSSVVLNPSVTTVYSVTGTSTLSGCSSTNVFTVSVKECVGIREMNNPEISIYPNPCEEEISILNLDEEMLFRIFDNQGNEVDRGFVDTKNNRIPLSFSGGVYVLQLYSPQGYAVLKFVKN